MGEDNQRQRCDVQLLTESNSEIKRQSADTEQSLRQEIVNMKAKSSDLLVKVNAYKAFRKSATSQLELDEALEHFFGECVETGELLLESSKQLEFGPQDLPYCESAGVAIATSRECVEASALNSEHSKPEIRAMRHEAPGEDASIGKPTFGYDLDRDQDLPVDNPNCRTANEKPPIPFLPVSKTNFEPQQKKLKKPSCNIESRTNRGDKDNSVFQESQIETTTIHQSVKRTTTSREQSSNRTFSGPPEQHSRRRSASRASASQITTGCSFGLDRPSPTGTNAKLFPPTPDQSWGVQSLANDKTYGYEKPFERLEEQGKSHCIER